MPLRPGERDIPSILNDLVRRMNDIERHRHNPQEIPIINFPPVEDGYFWTSSTVLTTGVKTRFYPDRPGRVLWCRADRVNGDGGSTATLDVLLNGVTIFPTSTKPTVAAATYLGPQQEPDSPLFVPDDYLQVEIVTTGGGTGPFHMTIHYIEL